jgi:hypothetical protein
MANMHVVPVQVRPQLPQFFGSDVGSRHTPPQAIWVGSLQTQVPMVHGTPAGQGSSQAPQWAVSLVRSTQPPPQHDSVAVHAVSQLPQWASSLVVSTHVPPQSVSVPEQPPPAPPPAPLAPLPVDPCVPDELAVVPLPCPQAAIVAETRSPAAYAYLLVMARRA